MDHATGVASGRRRGQADRDGWHAASRRCTFYPAGSDAHSRPEAPVARVTMYAEIEAPAEDVWQTVRTFDRPDRFLPPVKSVEVEGEGVGAVRTLTLEDGRRLVERLEDVDEDERTLRYSLVDSPLPMRNYVSTMKVEEREDGGCEVQWACRYRPAGATAAEVKTSIQDLYSLGFNGLKELHEG